MAFGVVAVAANGAEVGRTTYDRAGLFIFESDLPAAADYTITISASPVWQAPPDDRVFSVNLGMIRLFPAAL